MLRDYRRLGKRISRSRCRIARYNSLAGRTEYPANRSPYAPFVALSDLRPVVVV